MRMKSDGNTAMVLPSKSSERFGIGLQTSDFDNAVDLLLAEYGASGAFGAPLQRAFVRIEGGASLRQVAEKLLHFATQVERLAALAETRVEEEARRG